MNPNLHRSPTRANRAHVSALDTAIAARLGVSPRTVNAMRHGHTLSRPHYRTAVILEVCYERDDFAAAAHVLQPIALANARAAVPEFTTNVMRDVQLATIQCLHGTSQFQVTLDDESYMKWRRAAISCIASLDRAIAAGDIRWAA